MNVAEVRQRLLSLEVLVESIFSSAVLEDPNLPRVFFKEHVETADSFLDEDESVLFSVAVDIAADVGVYVDKSCCAISSDLVVAVRIDSLNRVDVKSRDVFILEDRDVGLDFKRLSKYGVAA